MRVALVTAGLEHLGIEALAAWLRAHGHEPVVVYEPRPFSSGSGTDSAPLARLLEPTPSRPRCACSPRAPTSSRSARTA
ncbi:MAG: hypothetical protein U0325_06775 [Polyangiales bacterium]